MMPREEKSRHVWDLIGRAKQHIERTKQRQMRQDAEAKKRATRESKNVNSRRIDEEQKLEDEARQAYEERQSKLQRIGSFKFDIDDYLAVEVLTSD